MSVQRIHHARMVCLVVFGTMIVVSGPTNAQGPMKSAYHEVSVDYLHSSADTNAFVQEVLVSDEQCRAGETIVFRVRYQNIDTCASCKIKTDGGVCKVAALYNTGHGVRQTGWQKPSAVISQDRGERIECKIETYQPPCELSEIVAPDATRIVQYRIGSQNTHVRTPAAGGLPDIYVYKGQPKTESFAANGSHEFSLDHGTCVSGDVMSSNGRYNYIGANCTHPGATHISLYPAGQCISSGYAHGRNWLRFPLGGPEDALIRSIIQHNQNNAQKKCLQTSVTLKRKFICTNGQKAGYCGEWDAALSEVSCQ